MEWLTRVLAAPGVQKAIIGLAVALLGAATGAELQLAGLLDGLPLPGLFAS